MPAPEAMEVALVRPVTDPLAVESAVADDRAPLLGGVPYPVSDRGMAVRLAPANADGAIARIVARPSSAVCP